MKNLFFISFLRAREKKLADRIDLERMIGAVKIEESFKVLNDTDYAPFISGKSYNEIEEIIKDERRDLRKSLEVMGLDKETLDFIFLKDDLILLTKELKEIIFYKAEKENSLIKQYLDLIKEAKNRNFSNAFEIDLFLTNTYYKRAIDFCKRSGENNALPFFVDAYEIVKKSNPKNLKKRDEAIFKLEDGLIEKSKSEIAGIVPLLAFLIKKRRAEEAIRRIFASKKLGMETSKIQNIINSPIAS